MITSLLSSLLLPTVALAQGVAAVNRVVVQCRDEPALGAFTADHGLGHLVLRATDAMPLRCSCRVSPRCRVGPSSTT